VEKRKIFASAENRTLAVQPVSTPFKLSRLMILKETHSARYNVHYIQKSSLIWLFNSLSSCIFMTSECRMNRQPIIDFLGLLHLFLLNLAPDVHTEFPQT
jgi:hypothetical protein